MSFIMENRIRVIITFAHSALRRDVNILGFRRKEKFHLLSTPNIIT